MIRQAVQNINAGRYAYAVQGLNTVVSSGRNARWYYLSALANYGQGNAILAMEQIQRAVQMEPGNTVYQTPCRVCASPAVHITRPVRNFRNMPKVWAVSAQHL